YPQRQRGGSAPLHRLGLHIRGGRLRRRAIGPRRRRAGGEVQKLIGGWAKSGSGSRDRGGENPTFFVAPGATWMTGRWSGKDVRTRCARRTPMPTSSGSMQRKRGPCPASFWC